MTNLKLTEIYIFQIKNQDPKNILKAFSRIVLNDEISISGIRILEGKNGLFVSLPQEFRKEDKKYFNIVIPTTSEVRQYLNDEILDEYLSMTKVTEREETKVS